MTYTPEGRVLYNYRHRKVVIPTLEGFIHSFGGGGNAWSPSRIHFPAHFEGVTEYGNHVWNHLCHLES